MKSPAFALDIHDVLRHIDQRDYAFYATLNEEKKKAFKPTVVLRWMSVCPDHADEGVHLYLLNEAVNDHLYDIADHPELQYKLLAACGTGKVQRHGWIALPKAATKRSAIHFFLQELNPGANDLELDILFDQLDADSFDKLLRDCALLPEREKSLRDAYKKITKAKGT